MSGPASDAPLPAALAQWLDVHAESLDAGAAHAQALLPRLAEAGFTRIGVPSAFGGDGADAAAATRAIAAVAERSLAAAFVLWGHRASIEYLVRSPNEALRARRLPALLAGETAGATGLSNAMKFLSGIEALQIAATADPSGAARFRLSGRVPWATNLRHPDWLLAVAVERRDGAAPMIAALPADRPGLLRSADHDLLGLRGTNTAAVTVSEVRIGDDDLIAENARAWLPAVRPAFLGFQCGMPVGLARASLAAARRDAGGAITVLQAPLAAAEEGLDSAVAALDAGLREGRFAAAPKELFGLRIRLTEIALQAAQLELQASGGRAYHRDGASAFARRWREAAFLPVVTPSIAQLQGELARAAAAAA